MSTATKATESATEFKCSCGRTFAHEVSLKRHRWVTGHAEAEEGQAVESAAPVAPANPVAACVNLVTEQNQIQANAIMEQALAVLAVKRAEMEQRDRQRRAEAILNAQRQARQAYIAGLWATLVSLVQGWAQTVGRSVVKGATYSLVGAFTILVAATLLLVGFGAGSIFAQLS